MAVRDRVTLPVAREAQDPPVLAARPCLLSSATLRLAEVASGPFRSAATVESLAGAWGWAGLRGLAGSGARGVAPPAAGPPSPSARPPLPDPSLCRWIVLFEQPAGQARAWRRALDPSLGRSEADPDVMVALSPTRGTQLMEAGRCGRRPRPHGGPCRTIVPEAGPGHHRLGGPC